MTSQTTTSPIQIGTDLFGERSVRKNPETRTGDPCGRLERLLVSLLGSRSVGEAGGVIAAMEGTDAVRGMARRQRV